jgi:uncharacterized protein (TIGR02421 family)
MTTTTTAVNGDFTDAMLRGYRTDAHVRFRLPGGGLLNIDRKLPFIFVYRQPAGRRDEGTHQLLLGEASYLLALGAADALCSSLIRTLAEAGTAEFGSFLVLEVWAAADSAAGFVVHAPAGPAADSIEALRSGLRKLGAVGVNGAVSVEHTESRHPPELPPLLTAQECWEIGCLLLGVQLPAAYRDDEGAVYPVFLRRFRSLLSPVLRNTAFEFARVQTTAGLESYRALGPRRVGRALFDIDRELAEIENSYELLLVLSPINTNEAWREFRDGGCARTPDLHYRLLPVDPDLLKRRLYTLDLDEVADPALAFLLRDKRDHLDRQVTMLAERNTGDFRLASMRLYGTVDDMLLHVAREVLEQVPPPPPPPRGQPRAGVGAEEFARLARAEIELYRAALPDIAAEVQVRPDLVGLMVSRGNLLIDRRLSLPPHRVEALLHHEVGTHVLTYYNGRAQPLRQLCTGLAGYDELQEGLAVFTEFLAGGLSAFRMRVLAARVVAAHSVEHGADFIETFRLLTQEHGFTDGTAFDITERVHQCGGFTRDLIYLRGLLHVIEYVRAGGDIGPLFIGKIAARHVEIIEELKARGFLATPPLVPRILGQPATAHRIAAVRRGLDLIDMISEAA